jgi:hypothetical protein
MRAETGGPSGRPPAGALGGRFQVVIARQRRAGPARGPQRGAGTDMWRTTASTDPDFGHGMSPGSPHEGGGRLPMDDGAHSSTMSV